MSVHISEYLTEARVRASAYCRQVPEHQALVYAVEDIVAKTYPMPCIDIHTARRVVEAVCLAEDVNVPTVHSVRHIGNNFLACASQEKYFIALQGKQTRLTLLHELAHCLSAERGHGEEWRSTFVHLVRNHIGVEQAGFLASLYRQVNLPTKWD